MRNFTMHHVLGITLAASLGIRFFLCISSVKWSETSKMRTLPENWGWGEVMNAPRNSLISLSVFQYFSRWKKSNHCAATCFSKSLAHYILLIEKHDEISLAGVQVRVREIRRIFRKIFGPSLHLFCVKARLHTMVHNKINSTLTLSVKA